MTSVDTSLPTITGVFSYPPPAVPPSAGAPYMQASRLPENFVFILVGAALGFIILVVFAWRLLNTWSINRNSKRLAGGGINYTPLAEVKKKPVEAQSHDMADLSKLPRSFSSVPSLFFSPTAEVARQSQRPPSQHLPAGHYRDASDPHRR
jgi:hypothetical protein